MKVTTDFHIHTHHLGCADETMTLPEIVDRCEELELEEIAITDHLRGPDELEPHRRIREELLEIGNQITIYFGGEIDVNKEFRDKLNADPDLLSTYREEVGFQFFIGGPHTAFGLGDTSPEEVMALQHSYHLETCRNPLIDVLVHPYWFSRSDMEDMPWLEDYFPVPDALIVELARTAVETETAVEINAGAVLYSDRFSEDYKKKYTTYLNDLGDQGVKFSLSTDAHTFKKLDLIRELDRTCEVLGLTSEQIWHPDLDDIRHSDIL